MSAHENLQKKVTFITAFVCLVSAGGLFAADPGWPTTKNGTVYAANGSKIRGYMRNFYNAPNNPELLTGESEYQKAQKYKLNAIRFWVRAMYNSDGTLDVSQYASYPMDKVLSLMDAVVNQCAKYGMYCVFDYHVVSGRFNDTDLKRAKDWWSKVAPRFKNRSHVIYELYNEPSYSAGIGESGANRMLSLYNHVRALAPNNHIITFSMGRYEYTATITNMVDHVGSKIDWRKASLGYHSYGWGKGTEAALVAGMKKYPMINTELGSSTHIPIMERIGCAYAAWGKPQDNPEYVTWSGTPPTASTNKLPGITVSVKSTICLPGQTIEATATASDADGSVKSVTWFLDAKNLGQQSVSPWKWSVKLPTTPGVYAIWATATDDKGGSNNSDVIEVKVSSATAAITSMPVQAIAKRTQAPENRFSVTGRSMLGNNGDRGLSSGVEVLRDNSVPGQVLFVK